MKYTIFLLLIALFCCSCKEMAKEVTINPHKNQYLFIGHTYYTPSSVDPRIEKLNLKDYKGLWLGGDMCSETTKEQSTLDYMNNLFDLSNENTHWSVGNHDVRNGNLDWIRAYTGRDLFYTHTKDGITFIILDTNIGYTTNRKGPCEERTRQYDFLNHVLDTITQASHVILLGHRAIWGGVDAAMQCDRFANACASWFRFLCEETGQSRFVPHFYNKLVALEKQGIEVLFISGDGGIYSKSYHFESKEGIDFFISGINDVINEANPSSADLDRLSHNPDSVLVFTHNVPEQALHWEFINLDELSNQ